MILDPSIPQSFFLYIYYIYMAKRARLGGLFYIRIKVTTLEATHLEEGEWYASYCVYQHTTPKQPGKR